MGSAPRRRHFSRSAAALVERVAAAMWPAAGGLRDPMDVIRQRLMERGWLAPDPVVERVSAWPWASPAPPGWLEGAGSPGREGDDG